MSKSRWFELEQSGATPSQEQLKIYKERIGNEVSQRGKDIRSTENAREEIG